MQTHGRAEAGLAGWLEGLTATGGFLLGGERVEYGIAGFRLGDFRSASRGLVR